MTFIPSPPPASKLNELQVSLLRMFDHHMTAEETLEIKRVLVRHYSEQLSREAERASDERGYTATDFEQMLNAPS